MSELSMYEKGINMLKEEYTKPHGTMLMVLSTCEHVSKHEDNSKMAWLQAYVLGHGKHEGIVGMGTNIHMLWPVPPRRGHHRSNFKEYNERLEASQNRVIDMLHILEALRYIAEISLKDYEWEDNLQEIIEHLVDAFDFLAPPDEEDRSAVIRKIYQYKREYNAGLKNEV